MTALPGGQDAERSDEMHAAELNEAIQSVRDRASLRLLRRRHRLLLLQHKISNFGQVSKSHTFIVSRHSYQV